MASQTRTTAASAREQGATGLRERKRARTRAAISDAAIALFLARGFDQVSVVEVAAAAEVSKRTLFAYFPTKEDLVLHRIADHEEENARVVRQRPNSRSPLEALREHVLDGLRRRDPITGLCDHPEPLALLRLLTTTPSLALRLRYQLERGEQALTTALLDTVAGLEPLTAALAAAQISATLRALAESNVRQVLDGADPDELHPRAVAAVDHAFDLLGTGLSPLR